MNSFSNIVLEGNRLSELSDYYKSIVTKDIIELTKDSMSKGLFYITNSEIFSNTNIFKISEELLTSEFSAGSIECITSEGDVDELIFELNEFSLLMSNRNKDIKLIKGKAIFKSGLECLCDLPKLEVITGLYDRYINGEDLSEEEHRILQSLFAYLAIQSDWGFSKNNDYIKIITEHPLSHVKFPANSVIFKGTDKGFIFKNKNQWGSWTPRRDISGTFAKSGIMLYKKDKYAVDFSGILADLVENCPETKYTSNLEEFMYEDEVYSTMDNYKIYGARWDINNDITLCNLIDLEEDVPKELYFLYNNKLVKDFKELPEYSKSMYVKIILGNIRVGQLYITNYKKYCYIDYIIIKPEFRFNYIGTQIVNNLVKEFGEITGYIRSRSEDFWSKFDLIRLGKNEQGDMELFRLKTQRIIDSY